MVKYGLICDYIVTFDFSIHSDLDIAVQDDGGDYGDEGSLVVNSEILKIDNM